MDHFQIETAQNVSIQQNTAHIGHRILAYGIDLFIIIGYVIIMSFFMGLIILSTKLQWVYGLLLGLPIFFYFLVWETFWNGRTPGKAVLKIRVVRLDGSSPVFADYLIRWLLRFVDITLSSGGIALVSILFKGTGQRLGDIAAKTTVISDKQEFSLPHTLYLDFPEDYTPVYAQVTVFTDQDIAQIRTIYREAKIDQHHHVITELSNKTSALMGIIPQEKPLYFIAQVLKDYTYYTQNETMIRRS